MQSAAIRLNTKHMHLSLLLSAFIFAFAVCPVIAYALDNPSSLQPMYSLLLSEKYPYLSINQPIVPPAASININFGHMPGNSGDWVGVFHPETESNWDNVLRWSYTNGTDSKELPGPVAGSLVLDTLERGSYEARLFFNDNYEIKDRAIFRVGEIMGPREVASTPLDQGTLYAASDGADQECSLELPCSIQTAFGRLSAGDVLFLRGGTYILPDRLGISAVGTAEQPVTIESYPGEHAILDGNRITPEEIQDNPRPGLWVYVGNDYIHIRKIEVKNMGDAGIKLESRHNVIEGCIIHHNHYNGIHIVDGNWEWGSDAPFTNGYNTISDNIIYDNSDVGLHSAPFNDGGNSDGISISHSTENTIDHNLLYNNSDDGIDSYCSNHAHIAYNISHSNGMGANGNGNGFKTGCGRQPGIIGIGAVVERNISYFNRNRDFNYNGGTGQIFRYNTAYNNGETGFKSGADTIVEYNISTSPDHQSNTDIHDGHHNNSWQMQGTVEFISTNPTSLQFLQPRYGSAFEELGVYGFAP